MDNSSLKKIPYNPIQSERKHKGERARERKKKKRGGKDIGRVVGEGGKKIRPRRNALTQNTGQNDLKKGSFKG